ncbi:MAG: hypothetical protein LC121_16105 [Anaerolineae bacterium]|nr:hypothetical protein [Anaerolineae bacterium]
MIANALLVVALLAGSQDGATPPRNPAVVYKCKDAVTGIVVFSQTPCAPDASTVDTSKALRAGAPNQAVAEISDSVALSGIDLACKLRRSSVNDRYIGEVAQIDRSIGSLRRSKAYSMNNQAGMTRDISIETQVGALEQRRAALMQSSRDEIRAIDDDCAAQRKAELDRQESARRAREANSASAK